jgi:hypothetical protein
MTYMCELRTQNKPPYDIAIAKHGIPTDKTFQIISWDLF